MLVIKKGSFSLPLATTLPMRSDTKKSADSAISPTGLRQPQMYYGKSAHIAQLQCTFAFARKISLEVAVRRRIEQKMFVFVRIRRQNYTKLWKSPNK